MRLPLGAASDRRFAPRTPAYVVPPLRMSLTNILFPTNRIRIVDFGESFFISAPPQQGTGIPVPVCELELISQGAVGAGSDTWALACTLFHILAGQNLFDCIYDDPETVIRESMTPLGPPPEPWLKTWKTGRDLFFVDWAEELASPRKYEPRNAPSIDTTIEILVMQSEDA